jgi:hypothetical protein
VIVTWRLTPLIVLENVNVGCDLIEKALKKIGRNGTRQAFNEAVGSSEVPHGVPHQKISAFEKVRDAFFREDGLGQKFLVSFASSPGHRAAGFRDSLAHQALSVFTPQCPNLMLPV